MSAYDWFFVLVAIGCFFFLLYVFCYSAAAVRIADEIFYDPLEDSVRRYANEE